MRRFTRLALLLVALVGPAPALAAAEAPAAFANCSACHSLEKGVTLVGPSLYGVYGRKKASVAGYDYSAALKGKGGDWTAKDLDAFLKAPSDYAPGTKMAFGGIADAGQRSAVIAYLKTKR